MEIRKATVSDAPAVVSCVIEAFKEYMPLIGRTPGPMLEDYYAAIENHHVFVAQEGASVLGVVLLKDAPDDSMLLDVLATLPAHKGKGIGRALTAHAEDYMRSLGKRVCRLYTHVAYERTASIYHSIGYETYDQVEEYGFTRYYMKKQL